MKYMNKETYLKHFQVCTLKGTKKSTIHHHCFRHFFYLVAI